MTAIVERTKVVTKVVRLPGLCTEPVRPTEWRQVIAEIRAEHGLSQRELARQSGIDRNVLRRIERGDTSADIGVLEKLVAPFGYEFRLFSVTHS